MLRHKRNSMRSRHLPNYSGTHALHNSIAAIYHYASRGSRWAIGKVLRKGVEQGGGRFSEPPQCIVYLLLLMLLSVLLRSQCSMRETTMMTVMITVMMLVGDDHLFLSH